MLFKTLLLITFSAGLVRNLYGRTMEPKNRNGEPCDWFIDLMQKRRLSRHAKQVPTLLADVTEEPMEYEKYNYSAPFDFAGDHLSENETQMIGCNFNATPTPTIANVNEPCGVSSTAPTPKPTPPPSPPTTKPCTSPTTIPITTTTTEEPCEEKRAAQERKNSIFAKRTKAMIKQRLAQRLSLLEAGRKWQRKNGKKLPKRKRRVKRSRGALRKKIKKCKTKDCDNSSEGCVKENSPTERILFEANLHVGEGFQELLLDMLTPGDKTIKVAEEEESDKVPKMRWEVLQDERRK